MPQVDFGDFGGPSILWTSTEQRAAPGTTGPTVPGERDMTIPGMGEAADRCGDYRPEGFCDGAAHDAYTHVILRSHQCGRRECPRCWSHQWARKRTVSAVARVGAARHAADDDLDKRAVHVALTLPEGVIQSVEDLYEYRTKAVQKAREHGIRGGLVVPHPWRVTNEAEAEWKGAREQGVECAQGGVWRYVRENSTPWRAQVVWSPHYHVVGLSRDVKPGEEDSIWNVKNIERGGSHSLEPFYKEQRDGYEDMAGVVRYLLSHAGFEADGNRQAVTWYGALHGTNFKPEEELTTGAWQRIQDMAERVVGTEREESGEGGEDEQECPVEDCPGVVFPFGEWAKNSRLYRQDMDTLNLLVVRSAFAWHEGDVEPPPGLKEPGCAEDAVEALSQLIHGSHAGTTDWEKLRREHGSGEAILKAARDRYIVA